MACTAALPALACQPVSQAAHPYSPPDCLPLLPVLQPGPPVDLNTMADLFLQRNMVREATAFLLDVLQVRQGVCLVCRLLGYAGAILCGLKA